MKQGTVYYVNAVNGDNRNDGLDHGGWVVINGCHFRNIHFLRTIQKAIDIIVQKQSSNP